MKYKTAGIFIFILMSLLLCSCRYDQNEFINLIKNGFPNEIQSAINAGAQVNEADELGITPLMVAIEHSQDREIIRILLEAGADVNAVSKHHETPLTIAAKHTQIVNFVEQLLQYGANTSFTDDKGNTPLILACLFNNNPLIIDVLSARGKNINHQNANGETALMMACQNHSNIQMIQSLIEAGADLSLKDNQEETALIKTIKHLGTKDMIDLLIKNGADVREKDAKGKNLLILAIEHSASPQVLETLLLQGVSLTEKDNFGKKAMDYIKSETPNGIEQAKAITSFVDQLKSLFWEEIKTGDVETVKKYLDYGFNLNEKDWYQRTPLMIAAASNPNPDVIQLLIDSGAKVNLFDKDIYSYKRGNPALVYAIRSNPNSEVIRVLIDNGASVNEEYVNDETPLMIAAEKNPNPDCIQLLIDKGADINRRNDQGETALMIAAKHNTQVGIIQTLIDNGAVVNDQDENQITPLMLALSNENTDVVSALIQAGADVNAQGPSGETPLFFAVKDEKSARSIPLLLEAGADAKQVGYYGLTAYQTGKFDEAVTKTEGFQWLTADYYSNEFYFSSAVRNGEEDIVSLVLTHCDLPETQLNEALMEALSENASYHLVQLLIQAGADVNAQSTDYDKTYPLIVAAEKTEDPQIIILLLDAGADPLVTNRKHQDALNYAKLNPNLKNTVALEKLGDLMPVYTANFLNYFSNGDLFEINRCLKSGQLTQDDLNNGLVRALSVGMSYKLIQSLIFSGANVNANINQTYPLIEAVKKTTDTKVIELLLDAGADPYKRDLSQQTAWDYTIKNKTIHSTEAYNRLKEQSPMSVSDFFVCMALADVEQIQLALDSGMPPNVRNDKELTPLMYTVKHSENASIVQLLIGKGADLTLKDSTGQTPLMMALKENGNIEIIRMLLNQTEDFTVVDEEESNLLMAAVQNKIVPVEIFQFLIDKGIDINARDKYGATVLHDVCQDVDKFRFLLDAGVDVNTRRLSETPLMKAVLMEFEIEIIKLLINHGAEIDCVSYGTNALGGFLTIDTSNETPLMVAIQYQLNPDIIELLIRSGADVSYVNPDNDMDCLLYAVIYDSDPQIIRWLLEAGAQPNLLDFRGRSAISYAEEKDYPIELLNDFNQLIPYAEILEDQTNVYDAPGLGTKCIATYPINKRLEIVGRDFYEEWIKIYDPQTKITGWIYEDYLYLDIKERKLALVDYTPGHTLLYPTKEDQLRIYTQLDLESGEKMDCIYFLDIFFSENYSELLVDNKLNQDVVVNVCQDQQVKYTLYVKHNDQLLLAGMEPGEYDVGYRTINDFDSRRVSNYITVPTETEKGLFEAGMQREYVIYSYTYYQNY